MLFGLSTEALDGASGLLFASTTNKPPRRFGGEEEENDEGSLDESALVGTRSEMEGGTYGEDPL